MKVFNRATKLLQRERAALAPNSAAYDFLRDEIGGRLADRLHVNMRMVCVGMTVSNKTRIY